MLAPLYYAVSYGVNHGVINRDVVSVKLNSNGWFNAMQSYESFLIFVLFS